MPALRTPSLHCTLKSSLGSVLGFPSKCDQRGAFIDLYSSCPEDLFSSPDELNSSSISLAQWIGSTPLLSDLEVYESGSLRAPPAFSTPPFDNHHYMLPENSVDAKHFDWSYDTSSSTSGSPHIGLPMEAGFGFAMSPSISITNSSPRSESELLPPSRDYNHGIEFSHCYSNPHNPMNWSTQPSPRYSHSPSPTLSNYEAQSQASRDPSPARSDTEKVDRRRFPCLILGCDRRFTSQYTLKVHMEAHKPKPKVSFQCTEGCQERFSRQHDRLRHEVAKHGKVCEFLCDDCGRFFGSKKTLGNHKCPVAQGSTRWVSS